MKKLQTKKMDKKIKIESETGITIINSPIVPIMEASQAREIYKKYNELCLAIQGDGDFTKIGNKKHPNKQFANKLARMFGLSVEIIKAEKESAVKRTTDPNGNVKNDSYFVWHIVARAIAPNGQYRDGDGHCATSERNFAHYHHDVYAQAVTRAKNRAILELVGMGEVSEEEITSAKANSTGKPIEEISIPVIESK